MRRILFLLTFGLGGVAILLSLCFWQVQRLDWKRGILAEIEAKLAEPEVPLMVAPVAGVDDYRPVTLTGTPSGQELHVLSSGTVAGTGYRVISRWLTDDGRAVMVDMGVMPLDLENAAPALDVQTISGNIAWPDDAAASSPPPDANRNLWYARDTDAMAAVLQAEPFMVVLRSSTAPDPRLVPVPVDTSGIKNDHREYAITWFLLAVVWAAMTAYFIFRPAAKKD